jgi:hypothetical protein
VGRTAGLGPAFGLQLAPLEIFPKRRLEPLGARGVALPVAGLAAPLNLLAARHGLSIRRAFAAGKPTAEGSLSGPNLDPRFACAGRAGFVRLALE